MMTNARVFLLLFLCCLQLVFPVLPAYGQEVEPGPPGLDQIISEMTPEEKVAQLFLVTFPGTELDEASIAAALVRDIGVGGVLLRASNGNYQNNDNLASTLVSLTNGLQTLATEGEEPFIPPFVAIDLFSPSPFYADGLPQNGFTEIPSEMAIGATWKPENARIIGRIVGQELQAVGINMLLGPALDVVDAPRTEQQSNLGTRTFGGDPFWVGEMGQAFIQGVAEGGQGSVATVARHFPGLGSSDRRPDEEIATVQKPLQALQQEDLPPFFAVTNATGVVSDTRTVDGLMTTNLRYRGLQGNIRQITRPISLDAQNLPPLINQPELQPWRQQGGILVSDELGALALRRFYTARQSDTQNFPAVAIAQDAFNAGHDLLLLADFAAEEDWQARLENIEQVTIRFAEQYESDPTFAAQVDERLRRILALKSRLYGGTFENARLPLPDPTALPESPLRQTANLNEIARITQEAATLLYPGPEELTDRLPAPPRPGESIVIVTDARNTRDCAECQERPIIAPDALATELLQRYGPGGSGQLTPAQITNLTFEEVRATLIGEASGDTGTQELRSLMENADWLIFLTQNISPENASSDALRLFLRDYTPPSPDQKLIVFSFGAPYYLDATEVSKLTAYYGFYTPNLPTVNAAARLLFLEYPARGAAPVSLHPLLNYRLDVQLSPDPEQVVQLCLDTPVAPADTCVLPTDEDAKLGSQIPLRTSVIRDHNGNPVPDGTIVTFIERYPNENNIEQRQQVQTVDGIGRAVMPLDREGQIEIEVTGSEPRTFTSNRVIFTIPETERPVVITVVPTPMPSPTPSVTPEPSVTPQPRPTEPPASPTASATATPSPLTRLGQQNNGFGWWVLWGALLGLVGIGSLGVVNEPVGRTTLVRRVLLVALWGLVGYVLYLLLYAFRMLPVGFDGWGAIVITLLAGLLALVKER